jgi:hypothetical protein
MVAAEKRLLFLKVETEVLGSVAGGMQRGNGPAFTTSPPAIIHLNVWGKRLVIPGFQADVAGVIRNGNCASAAKRRIMPVGQPAREAGMIEVIVRDKHSCHASALDGRIESEQMILLVRAGIDHRDIAFIANNDGAGAGPGKPPRIPGNNTLDARRHTVCGAVLERKGSVEWNHGAIRRRLN